MAKQKKKLSHAQKEAKKERQKEKKPPRPESPPALSGDKIRIEEKIMQNEPTEFDKDIKRSEFKWRDPITVATVVIALATVANVFVAFFMWSVMNKGHSLSQQMFRAATNPQITLETFMPLAVFDDGYNRDSIHPKFSLKGFLAVQNPNTYDVSISEMRLYGRSSDTSGKYKTPINYDLNIAGVLDSKEEDLVKARSGKIMRFHFAHFDNDTEPGIMKTPMAGRGDKEGLLFSITNPSFNQLFKYNQRRTPYQLVDEIKNSQLFFAVVFNNQLHKLDQNRITDLQACSRSEWEDREKALQLFYSVKGIADLLKKPKPD